MVTHTDRVNFLSAWSPGSLCHTQRGLPWQLCLCLYRERERYTHTHSLSLPLSLCVCVCWRWSHLEGNLVPSLFFTLWISLILSSWYDCSALRSLERLEPISVKGNHRRPLGDPGKFRFWLVDLSQNPRRSLSWELSAKHQRSDREMLWTKNNSVGNFQNGQ